MNRPRYIDLDELEANIRAATARTISQGRAATETEKDRRFVDAQEAFFEISVQAKLIECRLRNQDYGAVLLARSLGIVLGSIIGNFARNSGNAAAATAEINQYLNYALNGLLDRDPAMDGIIGRCSTPIREGGSA